MPSSSSHPKKKRIVRYDNRQRGIRLRKRITEQTRLARTRKLEEEASMLGDDASMPGDDASLRKEEERPPQFARRPPPRSSQSHPPSNWFAKRSIMERTPNRSPWLNFHGASPRHDPTTSLPTTLDLMERLELMYEEEVSQRMKLRRLVAQRHNQDEAES